MILCIGWNDYLTEDVKKMLCAKESIVKSIVQTCTGFPEQYDCLDEYGNTIGYFRIRYGYFEVSCPDYDLNSTTVYGTEIDGYGYFTDGERAIRLEDGINAIDYFYDEIVKSIGRIDVESEEDEDEEIYFIKHPEDTSLQDVMRDLYYYQKTNMLQYEVMYMRTKGPVIGFKDACRRIIKQHRMVRNKYFPEANGADGISDEHVESEIVFMQNSKEFMQKIDTICWLFNRDRKDFIAEFRESSKKGWNSL